MADIKNIRNINNQMIACESYPNSITLNIEVYSSYVVSYF